MDSPTRLTRKQALRAATISLAAAAVAILALRLLRIPSIAPLDPNEGWNAYHAAAAMAGVGLYPDSASLYFNNYPPISFHVVAALATLVGDPISAGRLLSIISLAWLVAATGVVARALGADREHAAFGCAFLAAVFLTYSHYVGIADPQLFGHAVAATGLALVLRRPDSRLAAAGCAVCCACALFIKHNLIEQPLALLVWLALFHPRTVSAYTTAGLSAVALLLAACMAWYGAEFPSHLLAPRLYSVDELWRGSAKWLVKTLWFFVPLLWLAMRRRRDPAIAWCAVYAALAAAAGLYFIGGAGVDQNVFFDAYIAAALSSAVALERLRESHILPWYLAPLAVSLAVQFEPAWLQPDRWNEPSRRFAESIAFVSDRGGTAACVEQSLCFRAGMPPAVDYFNLGQQVAKGRRDERELVREIEMRRFATMQFAVAPPTDTPLGAGLARHYVEARRDAWGVYYVPRSQAQLTGSAPRACSPPCR